MSYLKQTKTIDNLMEALLRDHRRYLPIVEFLDSVVHNAAELSWADCERIGLALGKQNGSEFCAGIRAGMVDALGPGAKATDDGKLRPLRAFARKLNRDSRTITETDIQSARDAGWSDQTVEDVVGLVGCLKVYSILANGLGFKALPDAVFADMGAATVKMKGYAPLFRSYVERIEAA